MTIAHHWLGYGALVLAAVALAGCHATHPAGSAPDEHAGVKQFVLDTSAAVETKAGFPQWAFPGPLLKSLAPSRKKFSDVQMFDRTTAIDWYPGSHPEMPDIVRGRPSTYACGFCHLPQGAGRSENAALAGLPSAYIIAQVHNFRNGLRKTADRAFGPAVNMETTASHASDADIEQAARYFSSLKYVKHVRLVQNAEVPHFTSNAFVYVFDEKGPREPLGNRIIEGPDDFERFEMRDPAMTFTAYVPPGAVTFGAAIAKGDGERPPCASCHGAGLRGGQIGPPLAGRLPSGIFRQLYGFQTGARNGAGAAIMKPIVAKLSQKDMIDLSAYVASLNP